MKKLVLIDGNSIANRAFYALPLLSNSNGLHTNAVYGFTTMLLRLIEEEQPTHFLVAFDAGKKTFRNEQFSEYKGGRAKTPPELSEQFPLIKELLEAFSISQFEMPGYEADDIIGTLTKLGEEENMEVLVVSGDKDMLQLASEHVTIAITKKGISEVELYNPAYILEKYGLTPNQIIDLKGLMGDASDNIPGIPGIGEKTGLKLLHEYGTVEEVLNHVSELKGKMKEKIEDHAEDAKMSKELATIFREVPLEQSWTDLQFKPYEEGTVLELFRKLEFKSLIEKMNLSEKMNKDNEEEKLLWQTVGKEDFASFFKMLPEIKAFHAEIIGENPHQAEIVGLSFYAEDKGYYIPYDELHGSDQGPLKNWFADEHQEKWTYDSHKVEVALSWEGYSIKGVTTDILLAAYLLDPTASDLSLNQLAKSKEIPFIASDDDVFGKGAKFHIPGLSIVGEHLCRKALAIQRLAPVLLTELENNGMKDLYHHLELPLAGVLASMEKKGICVDKEGLVKYGQELDVEIQKLIKKIHEHAQTEFNINSPKQLGEILFDKLDLPIIKKTKTGYSTDAEVLEKLEPYHEIIPSILHYRQLAKLQSTYVEGLLKEIRQKQSKIHTYFRQTIAATGRLSSQFPNLQNIPIRLEEGRKIRKVFVPSKTDWVILAADYSQIELRVLAHIAKDENLKDAFLKDMDIHTKTAMDVFGVNASDVDANMRRQAKAVNFGIVYGISDYGLSQNLHITRKEAAQFIEQYFAVFKGVRQFMDDVVKQAKEDGFVTTLLHRRRYLPEIKASNFNLRSFAERTAMNTPIQGTAADIIKLAMVQMAVRLEQEKLKSRLLLQVHDELVFEVPKDEIKQMSKLVPEVMENALQLDVPLKVDVSYGDNWYEAK